MECSYKNRSHWKNISKEKIRRHVFVVYVLIYPLSKFEGHWTNSLWVLAFFSVRFKWKNWFEKTALNMLIRRVIFTSGQNLKPPFLCQYLIRSMISFFALEISFGSSLFHQKIEIWRKLSIWRYTVTLKLNSCFMRSKRLPSSRPFPWFPPQLDEDSSFFENRCCTSLSARRCCLLHCWMASIVSPMRWCGTP